MGEPFEMDWSFIFVLVMVAILVTSLAVRSSRIKRRQKAEEKRAAKRAFNEWMASSSQPLERRQEAPPER